MAISADKSTKDIIAQQEQAMANNAALTEATNKATDQQKKLTFEQNMHEMNAKLSKGQAEALKGLC